MLIITLYKLGNNIQAKIVDNTLNLEVNYYEDSSNLTLVYNIKNNTVTLSIKGTTSYTTPNITTNACLFFDAGAGLIGITDQTIFNTNYTSLFPASTGGGGGTPNIDTVLAQGGTLTANRQIDGDGGAFTLDFLALLRFFARNPDGNGIFAYFDSNQIEIKNNQTGTYPSNMSLLANDVQFTVDSQGFYADSSAVHRASSIGDVQGQYNGTSIGADDLNNTLTAKGNNITTTSAGGNAGKHLKININGTNYKIALLNP